MGILSALTGDSMEAISAQYDGKGYGVFKDAVADAVIAELEPSSSAIRRSWATRPIWARS